MSQALRKLAGTLNRTDTICLFTNQLREKIGVMFGSPETTPGGRALKFYSSVRPRHPPHRDAEGRRRGDRQPRSRQGRQEQGRAAVQAGRVRHHLRLGHLLGEAPCSTPASSGRSSRSRVPTSASATSGSGRGARTPTAFLREHPDAARADRPADQCASSAKAQLASARLLPAAAAENGGRTAREEAEAAVEEVSAQSVSSSSGLRSTRTRRGRCSTESRGARCPPRRRPRPGSTSESARPGARPPGARELRRHEAMERAACALRLATSRAAELDARLDHGATSRLRPGAETIGAADRCGRGRRRAVGAIPRAWSSQTVAPATRWSATTARRAASPRRRSTWRSSRFEPERVRAARLCARRGAGPQDARYLARKGFSDDAIETSCAEAVAEHDRPVVR